MRTNTSTQHRWTALGDRTKEMLNFSSRRVPLCSNWSVTLVLSSCFVLLMVLVAFYGGLCGKPWGKHLYRVDPELLKATLKASQHQKQTQWTSYSSHTQSTRGVGRFQLYSLVENLLVVSASVPQEPGPAGSLYQNLVEQAHSTWTWSSGPKLGSVGSLHPNWVLQAHSTQTWFFRHTPPKPGSAGSLHSNLVLQAHFFTNICLGLLHLSLVL